MLKGPFYRFSAVAPVFTFIVAAFALETRHARAGDDHYKEGGGGGNRGSSGVNIGIGVGTIILNEALRRRQQQQEQNHATQPKGCPEGYTWSKKKRDCIKVASPCDPQRRGRRRAEQLIQVDASKRRLVLAVDLHVGRREHVLALDLHAVAGIIDERDLRPGCLALERLQHVQQVGARQIVMLGDLETVGFQRSGDRLGVRHRVVEAGEMLVLAHADDQRDALLLRLSGKNCQCREQGKGCNEKAMHGVRPLGTASAGED